MSTPFASILSESTPSAPNVSNLSAPIASMPITSMPNASILSESILSESILSALPPPDLVLPVQ